MAVCGRSGPSLPIMPGDCRVSVPVRDASLLPPWLAANMACCCCNERLVAVFIPVAMLPARMRGISVDE